MKAASTSLQAHHPSAGRASFAALHLLRPQDVKGLQWGSRETCERKSEKWLANCRMLALEGELKFLQQSLRKCFRLIFTIEIELGIFTTHLLSFLLLLLLPDNNRFVLSRALLLRPFQGEHYGQA